MFAWCLCPDVSVSLDVQLAGQFLVAGDPGVSLWWLSQDNHPPSAPQVGGGGIVSALQLFSPWSGVTSGWNALNALFLRDVGNCDGHSGLGDAVSKSKGF